jgi:hypothetical protein
MGAATLSNLLCNSMACCYTIPNLNYIFQTEEVLVEITWNISSLTDLSELSVKKKSFQEPKINRTAITLLTEPFQA